MLVNQLEQGGIRALLAWDGTLFDNMVVPDGIDRAAVVDHIIYKYGDTPLFSPSPNIVKYYIREWSRRRLPLWERYKRAVDTSYNPLENYDRYEDSEHVRENTTQHTGDVSTESNGETINQRAADNSTNWENFDRDSGSSGSTTTNDLTDQENGSDVIKSHIHGNIGVLTSQQMLVSELDLIPRLDIIDYIADDWHSEFNLMIY